MRYTDAYNSDAFNDARGKITPYTLANAQISYRAGPVPIYVAASNLFNTADAIYIFLGESLTDSNATITPQRRITGGIEITF